MVVNTDQILRRCYGDKQDKLPCAAVVSPREVVLQLLKRAQEGYPPSANTLSPHGQRVSADEASQRSIRMLQDETRGQSFSVSNQVTSKQVKIHN